MGDTYVAWYPTTEERKDVACTIAFYLLNAMNAEPEFKGFNYVISDVVRFLPSHDFFTIMLKNGKIVHHCPENYYDFLAWLRSHQIPDVRESWTKELDQNTSP